MPEPPQTNSGAATQPQQQNVGAASATTAATQAPVPPNNAEPSSHSAPGQAQVSANPTAGGAPPAPQNAGPPPQPPSSAPGLAGDAKRIHERWQPLVAIVIAAISICSAGIFAYTSKANVSDLEKERDALGKLSSKFDLLSHTVDEIGRRADENIEALKKTLATIDADVKAGMPARGAMENAQHAQKERIDRLENRIDELMRSAKAK